MKYELAVTLQSEGLDRTKDWVIVDSVWAGEVLYEALKEGLYIQFRGVNPFLHTR